MTGRTQFLFSPAALGASGTRDAKVRGLSVPPDPRMECEQSPHSMPEGLNGYRSLFTSLCLTALLFNRLTASPLDLDAARSRLKALCLAQKLPYPPPNPELRITKSQRKLELHAHGKHLQTYNVGLGGSPVGDKEREGDQRTPEGSYTICVRNQASRFHLFLGLSYPNEASAEQGFRKGLITRAQRDRILRSIRLKTCPPWNTPLGGQVGIHGSGADSDWTWGCIALSDGDIEELWIACPLGTPVIIRP